MECKSKITVSGQGTNQVLPEQARQPRDETLSGNFFDRTQIFRYYSGRTRGVVKWYHKGLQNPYPEFDSQRPCKAQFERLMTKTLKKRLIKAATIILPVLCLALIWELYIPKSLINNDVVLYNAQKGMGDEDIAKELKEQGIIKSAWMFRLYTTISGQSDSLQAGIYDFSPAMSMAAVVKKLVKGDVAKQKLTILEGWDAQDMAEYLESKKFAKKEEFLELLKKDYSATPEFGFLKGKPKDVTLEGYLFPDTYVVPIGSKPEDLVVKMLANFGRVMTADLQKEIAKQKKSIFQIVTMASIVEKEVRLLEDKKMVSGILWKRIQNGMALQVDSTVNYATGDSYARSPLKSLKIDSPYNTYKYKGLPKGPISSPGIDSIMAAVYPTKSEYWYFLSAFGTGKTIFSKTYKDHTVAIAEYLD